MRYRFTSFPLIGQISVHDIDVVKWMFYICKRRGQTTILKRKLFKITVNMFFYHLIDENVSIDARTVEESSIRQK